MEMVEIMLYSIANLMLGLIGVALENAGAEKKSFLDVTFKDDVRNDLFGITLLTIACTTGGVIIFVNTILGYKNTESKRE